MIGRAVGLLGLFWAGAATAHPCEAALPARDQVFTGLVRYVGDGDSLCVGRTDDPATWIHVRLADFYAPELNQTGGRAARTALVDMAMGRTVRCVAQHRSYDRIVARCTLAGVSLGDRLRRSGIVQGGRGWRG